MNIIVLIIRIVAGIGYFLLAIHVANGGYRYAELAAVIIGLVVSFPVFRMLYKGHRPLPAKRLRPDEAHATIFRWIRKGIALFLCLLVVGALQRHKYQEGIVMALICAVFLSPLDSLLFGPPVPVALEKRQQSARYIVIVTFRDAGLILYAIGVDTFTDHTNDREAIDMIIAGILMLFVRPVAMLLVPYKPMALAEPGQKTLTGPQEGPLPERGLLPEQKHEAPLPNGQDGPGMPELAGLPAPETLPELAGLPAVEELPDLAALKTAYSLLAQMPPQKRGYAFQDFLNDLFTAHHISARGAFRLVGEEIDGSFDLGSQTYLLEAKWQSRLTPQSDLAVFNSKVEGKSTWARGIFISHCGFTSDGLKAFAHGRRTSIIGMDGQDLLLILDGVIALDEAIKRKARRAVESNDFFVPLRELI
jgi:hypothetical protein